MDWLTFTTHIVDAIVSLAWPAVALVLVFLLLPHFSGLAARIESLKLPGGAEAHFLLRGVESNLAAAKSVSDRIRSLNAVQALALARAMEPNLPSSVRVASINGSAGSWEQTSLGWLDCQGNTVELVGIR
jgi:hypothetical protein